MELKSTGSTKTDYTPR